MISFKNKKMRDTRQPAIILDTCALIDGRIVDIAKAGFVPRSIIVPQFVIAELQLLADKGDSHKRERARFGLDVIRSLQDLRRVDISIAREQFPEIREVDDKLIALAKQHGAMLYTTDYNLNKVAQIEGIIVLNVNELAQALRPNRLPGERMELKITQTGQDKTQGVGYLDDGTMVVVEKAGNKIGQRISVEFSRMLQTQAGKMMFAVLPERPQPQMTAPASEQRKPQQQPQLKKQFTPKPQPAVQLVKKTGAVHVMPRKQQQPLVPRLAARVQAPARPVDQTQSQSVQAGRHRHRRRKATPEDSLLNTISRLQG